MLTTISIRRNLVGIYGEFNIRRLLLKKIQTVIGPNWELSPEVWLRCLF